MCAVSAVTDYYRDKWLQQPIVPLYAPEQYVPPVVVQPAVAGQLFFIKPGVTITPEQWKEYQELKRRMEEYDAATNQPDCIKPEVAVWEAIVEQIVNKEE